jgi:type I site-specific restriction endonuclease
MNKKTNNAGEFWDNADVIYAYTRAQAIEDGQLIDVTENSP